MANVQLKTLQRTESFYSTSSDEEVAKVQLNKKLLALAVFLTVGSAALITALYLPEHMPTVIDNIVNNLSTTNFYLILAAGIFGGAAGVYAGYKSKTILLDELGTFSRRNSNENIVTSTNDEKVVSEVVSEVLDEVVNGVVGRAASV